jgi:hypothetical protein
MRRIEKRVMNEEYGHKIHQNKTVKNETITSDIFFKPLNCQTAHFSLSVRIVSLVY